MKRLTLPQVVALAFAALLGVTILYSMFTKDNQPATLATAPGILGITFLLGVSAAKATKGVNGD